MLILTTDNIPEQISRFNQIGRNRVTASLNKTNIFHRAINYILGSEAKHNRTAIKNLIGAVKRSPDFCSAYSAEFKTALRYMHKEGKPLTGRKVARLLKKALDRKTLIERNKQNIKNRLDALPDKEICTLGKNHFTKTECITIRNNVLTDMQSKFAKALRDAGDYATLDCYTLQEIKKEVSRACKAYREQAAKKSIWL